MSEQPMAADVSQLPTTTFGHRSMMWWGTVGFIAIEGTTLLICAMSYVYLRRDSVAWPPEHVLPPALAVPTAQALLLLLSNLPMVWVDRAARRVDLPTIRKGMVIICVIAVGMCVLRWFEFGALNVRWDSNAYGSIAWATLTSHATLLLLETAETLAFTALLFLANLEDRDYSAVSDNALYWYFMTGAGVLLYILVFLSPYLI